jgi:hypothetical protein
VKQRLSAAWKKSLSAHLWTDLRALFSFPSPAVALVKLTFLVGLLVVVNEFSNSGKLIIQSFEAKGLEEEAGLVQSIDGLLLNDLALLNQQLQPELLLPNNLVLFSKQSSEPVEKREKVDYIRISNTATTIDTILKNSKGIDFGLFSIPPDLFVIPFQGTLRSLFKIRVVSGSLMVEGQDYVLLASMSDGRSWTARRAKAEETNVLAQALPELVSELAFKIISDEGELDELGMTRSWEAFHDFQNGVDLFAQYDQDGNTEVLASAIEAFLQATKKDPGFVLAYYRLGLSFQASLQAKQAETAFEDGLAKMPDFPPLLNALAYHKYFYAYYLPVSVPGAPSTPSPADISEAALEARTRRARALWHQVAGLDPDKVDLADRATAYFGLCMDALKNEQHDLAYFYCSKSHLLFARLPNRDRSGSDIRQADAYAIYYLGFTLESKGYLGLEADDSKMAEVKEWNCYGFEHYPYDLAYTKAALPYYKTALQLEPQDRLFLCDVALADQLLGKPELAKKLAETNSQMHLELANTRLNQINEKVNPAGLANSISCEDLQVLVNQGLVEYQRAIDIDPTKHEALNNYGYTYWLFRLACPSLDPSILEVNQVGENALQFAWEAMALVQAKQDRALEFIYTSTLAEVLIGNHQAQVAVELLTPVMQAEENLSYRNFSEVYLDWILARSCADYYEQDLGISLEAAKTKAIDTLRQHLEDDSTLLSYTQYSQEDVLKATEFRLQVCEPAPWENPAVP